MLELLGLVLVAGFVVSLYRQSREENLATKHVLLAVAWPMTAGKVAWDWVKRAVKQ